MDNQNEIDRAAKAHRLLEDETFKEAFADVRQALFVAIEHCPLRDERGLHELRLMLKLLNDVRANLEQRIDNGKIAAIRIEDEKRRSILGRNKWKRQANNP